MKIAIGMTGGMRTHWKERCWKSFKEKLLDKYDCDLYICSTDLHGQESEIEKIKNFYPNAEVSYVTEVTDIPGGPTVPVQTYEDMIQNLRRHIKSIENTKKEERETFQNEKREMKIELKS